MSKNLVTFLMLISLLGVIMGCGGGEEPEIEPTPTLTILSQWAATASASSEYGMPNWSASRATGMPNVDACADDPRAWASARGNGLEWLELHYDTAVYATEVRIYQTLGRGAIARVKFIDSEGAEQLIWEGTDTATLCPGVLSISVPRTEYQVVGVRVELDESRTGFWNQIDAVELIGVQ
ncbi:MAG: hypothetical protein ACP5GX_00930 [Anaerolineae bacterium]